MNVRISEEDRATLEQIAHDYGLDNRSAAVRLVIRNAARTLFQDPEERPYRLTDKGEQAVARMRATGEQEERWAALERRAEAEA